MPVYVSGSNTKEFTPAPEGTHQGVCVDVVDLGDVETSFGVKHKVEIYWQISESMENLKPFLVRKRYTASLHEKANLRHDLEAWRGKAFTEAELERFDLEALIGANCILGVIHRQGTKGGTFANVSTLAPLMKGMVKMAPDGYVRKRDRPTEATAGTEPGEDTRADVDGYPDSVPF